MALRTDESIERGAPRWREALCTLAVLWGLWAIARAPVWIHPIWLADDFNMWEFSFWGLTQGGAWQGRWINGPWYYLFYNLAPPPNHASAWLMHSIQGLLHAGVSAVGICLLMPRLGRWGAWIAVLPFHFWAFHTETTVWFAGSSYPLAACLSMLGVAVLCTGAVPLGWKRGLGGAFLIALSVHSNQAPALFGACFWIILVGLTLLQTEPLGRQWKVLWRQAGWIGGGYIAGVFVSILTMQLIGGERLAGAIVLTEKWAFWKAIVERLWWFPGIYPSFLKILNGLLLVACGIGVGQCILQRSSVAWKVVFAFVGLGGLLCLLPFAANLAASENYLSTRILYGGPVIWLALVAWLWTIVRGLRAWRWGVTLWILATAGFHVWLGFQETVEYAEVYARDRATLRELEVFAEEQGAHEVLFMDWANSAPWLENPFELDLYYPGGIKASVFQNIFSSYRFLGYYSETLEMTPWWPAEPGGPDRWTRLREKYAEFARNLPRDRWVRFEYLPEEDLILVVPR